MKTKLFVALIACCIPWLSPKATAASSPAPSPHNPSRPKLPFPIIERFENFGIADGMPSHKIHCVLVTHDGTLLVGTAKGLLIRENGKFRKLGTEHGLSHQIVLCLAEDQRNGDIWIGTMRGLNRYSAGRINSYFQTTSGLPNNIIYGVALFGDTLWVATAAGCGVLDLKTGSWKIYDHTNSQMHEPWVYSVAAANDRIFVGVWGSGILEYEPLRGVFKEYRDPDGDFHFDLVPDDGPVNDITAWLSWSDGLLWQATYFGMSRYDGLRWRTWQEKKSPLPSNFVQFIHARGRVAWVGTDNGLAVTDGDSWAVYARSESGDGNLEITYPDKTVEKIKMPTALPNNFVLGIWADDREAWFATSDGLGHGIFAATSHAQTKRQAETGSHKSSAHDTQNHVKSDDVKQKKPTPPNHAAVNNAHPAGNF